MRFAAKTCILTVTKKRPQRCANTLRHGTNCEGVDAIVDSTPTRGARAIPAHVKAQVDRRSFRRGNERQRVIPCEVCDANVGPVLEYHHIIPFEYGGPHSAQNLVKLCPTCHAFVTRDRCRWAAWPRTGLYPREIAQRISLLADIQHACDPISLGVSCREDAWKWLKELTGFTREDIPVDASWGNRWRREADANV